MLLRQADLTLRLPPVACVGDPPDATASMVRSWGPSTAEAIYACDTHHGMETGALQHTVMCQANGAWESLPYSCSSLGCLSPNNPGKYSRAVHVQI